MKGADRMYLPAELQGEGLALKLSLLAHKRFGLALKYADFIDQTISLPVIVADGRNVSTGNVTATPTHDGYYIAPIPIGDCRFSVGIQFGQLFDYVQVESATFMPVERFLSDKQGAGDEEIEATPSLEGMEQTAPHLFRCADEAAFMMVPPPPRAGRPPMMLAVVFRPIAKREAKPAPAAFERILREPAHEQPADPFDVRILGHHPRLHERRRRPEPRRGRRRVRRHVAAARRLAQIKQAAPDQHRSRAAGRSSSTWAQNCPTVTTSRSRASRRCRRCQCRCVGDRRRP
jgi:hypothetical protein